MEHPDDTTADAAGADDTDTADSALSPVQSGLRFVIELGALAAWAVVGSALAGGAAGWVVGVALSAAAAVAWGTFRVPGDRSANGNAPVPVPGVVRLMIELDVLLGAAVLLAVVESVWAGALLAAAVLVHYGATTRRVRWLLRRRS